ncbi:nicotinamide riboside transporter PnuC [Sphingomonas immobilis]|uniref:Nicotinamide riboside transporter PnuC n=1 Tax=Sphingomonas immobilis TaxID=3063997 RepID=A0ABT8ZWW4_9SPHN|nr:nicotinamide riboside transporter PnuC [Sphingomonas sp. CA1-15]MDO7840967.1 nicotinamide riboside transporter PnuC [Sphingomonas sp. CA1-15]
MSPFEIAASLLIVANVALVAWRSIWNYAFGVAGVLLYAFVFFEEKLYSDALLQIFFLVLQFYGWWNWSRSAADGGEITVERMTPTARLTWLAGIALATGIWGWLMHRFTDAALPFVDGGIAMASVAAQILLSRRKLENWVLWIAIDIASIGMYAAKGLRPTTALYVLLLAIALGGLIDWARVERRQATPRDVAA